MHFSRHCRSSLAAVALGVIVLAGCGRPPREDPDPPPLTAYSDSVPAAALAGGPLLYDMDVWPPGDEPYSGQVFFEEDWAAVAGPTVVTMEPIPNPEDLPPDERRRIYGREEAAKPHGEGARPRIADLSAPGPAAVTTPASKTAGPKRDEVRRRPKAAPAAERPRAERPRERRSAAPPPAPRTKPLVRQAPKVAAPVKAAQSAPPTTAPRPDGFYLPRTGLLGFGRPGASGQARLGDPAAAAIFLVLMGVLTLSAAALARTRQRRRLERA